MYINDAPPPLFKYITENNTMKRQFCDSESNSISNQTYGPLFSDWYLCCFFLSFKIDLRQLNFTTFIILGVTGYILIRCRRVRCCQRIQCL